MTNDSRSAPPATAGALRAATSAWHELASGRWSVAISAAGGGGSVFDGFALTRWAHDRTTDADGLFLYVRDLDGGGRWSAGHQPLRRPPDRYVVHVGADRVAIEREDEGIVLRTEFRLVPDAPVELRRHELRNAGDRPRRLELTTYAEVVLDTPAAGAAHPAFSKLFVQTGWLAEAQALMAWRRPRSPVDEPLWLVHLLVPKGEFREVEGDPEYETDRARFLGRGRTAADPAALDEGARLSGTIGNVLDPVFSLRRRVTLAPGATLTVVAALGAARSREEAEALAARLDRALRDGGAGARVGDRGAAAGAGWQDLTAALAPAPTQARPAASDPHAVGSTHEARGPSSDGTGEELRFDNGYGGFSADAREYVVRLPLETTTDGDVRHRRPPLPWANVLANAEAGCIVSESGAGYTWAENSRENRLTPWSNDPVSDPHGEALWLRDDDAGAFWSPTPGPTPAPAAYEVRHGFGYTTFHLTSAELEQETVHFVPRDGPLKIVRLRVTNRAGRARRLSVFWYNQWVLGGLAHETASDVVVRVDEESGALYATNPQRGEFSPRVAFAALAGPGSAWPAGLTADRAAFLGFHGSVAAPAALMGSAPLDGRTGSGLDPCAAFHQRLSLQPGETAECVVLLGEAEDEAVARTLVARFADGAAADAALAEVRDFWNGLLAGVHIETPSPAIDVMVNGWLAYQTLGCRMWGRSAFYQSGGAFGFRDQLQDAAALLYLDPAITRRQIVVHAAHQFVEGDVLHWWHPPTSKGIRTRFSDDLLWLPFVTAFYVRATGDAAVLDEDARFVTARQLEQGEDEVLLAPQDSRQPGNVYEHCCRALDRSLTAGAHGLPLIGSGDWNDGMNRVGRGGLGESVWLGFFLYDILGDFIPLCESRGDDARARRYREYQARLHYALNDGGWDGAWYRRAYYDDGEPLGAATNDECRIDAIAQAWAVLSGAAPADRADMALDALERHLVSEREGIIRLLAPAFDRTPHDPGYIKGYLPGVRENGGQYTHGALWAVRALAEAQRGDRAARLLEMLSPVTHARTPEEVAVYQVEPYVIAADVYGVEPHVGRGGWTWYTGSSGWMFRVMLESILGLCLEEGRTLTIRPRIPAAWPGYTLRWRLPDGRTTYEIHVARDGEPAAAGAGDVVTAARLDGDALDVREDGARVPLAADGGTHRVRITLGRAAVAAAAV